MKNLHQEETEVLLIQAADRTIIKEGTLLIVDYCAST